MVLYTLSFIANALITLTVANSIRRDTAAMTDAFGPDSPARRILACVYMAIGLVSIYGLIQIASGQPEIAATIGMTLFQLQIIYKLMTTATVGLQNVVVRANLGVVALLTVTLIFGG